LVRHLVKIFLQVSRSVIGLVILRSWSHALDFGIGYMLPLVHSVGIVPVLRILLKREVINCKAFGPSFLKQMYGIEDNPGADLLLLFWITLKISVVVKGVVKDSNH
jgi:hypothetical protein